MKPYVAMQFFPRGERMPPRIKSQDITTLVCAVIDNEGEVWVVERLTFDGTVVRLDVHRKTYNDRLAYDKRDG